MKIYKKSLKDSQTHYTCFDGVSDDEILTLMAEIGHNNIQDSSESEYITNALQS